MKTTPNLTTIRRKNGFTLIELLVVIAIIALLISIILPALNQAKNEGAKAQCLSNLREILKAMSMYDNDSTDDRRYPWYQIPAHNPAPTFNVQTPWVFGGFRATVAGMPGDVSDASVYPAQIRPLNKFVDRTATADLMNANDRGRDIIKVYQCPSDRSNDVAIVGTDASDTEFEQQTRSWQANGNSYTFNTRWKQGYYGENWSGILNTADDFAASSGRIAKHLVGGGAARFIMWVEQGMYARTYGAKPQGESLSSNSPPPTFGWHRKFSSYSAGFADGHALYGKFDTRYVYGLDGTIWQPNIKPTDRNLNIP
ncbi:Type II secretion system protein G precursor [Phycisphaerae bacterium RAS2]|nr:Type II secretion system protein G precursor [Phycisphaerae bacterium RAS2]